jgi:hypothetical protein
MLLGAYISLQKAGPVSILAYSKLRLSRSPIDAHNVCPDDVFKDTALVQLTVVTEWTESDERVYVQ